jgi:hypothetical protein
MQTDTQRVHESEGLQWRQVDAAAWTDGISLVLWLVAAVVTFLPFAVGTSPWDAVTLHVPGNQGNWWHALVGAPFFLAFAAIWIKTRSLFSSQPSTLRGRRFIFGLASVSILGTLLVETPFLLHLAGTSAWQRLIVLSLGLGIVVVSGAVLLVRRASIAATRGCVIWLYTAYLANAALCLVVYSDAQGSTGSRIGWFISMGLVWPFALELLVHLVRAFSGDSERSQ